LVTVDRILGTAISRQVSLKLRPRLQTQVLTTIHRAEHIEREACCEDSATWHYRPGSIYRTTFDCPTCSTPYELVADETGFLNLRRGLMDNSPSVGLFWAGDSVFQGAGVPSVVEELRGQIALSMWNLSIQAYGPRQKVSAVMAYALPKQPRWLIVEFYSGNDLPEAVRDDVCADFSDFRCRYNGPEIAWRLAHHPAYAAIFETSTDVFTRLADYCTRNMTLATTRYFFDRLKDVTKRRFMPRPGPQGRPPEVVSAPHYARISKPAWPPMRVRAGQWQTYMQAGMAATRQEYERLLQSLRQMTRPPRVILLYNPAPYEVYRGLGVEPEPRWDEASAFQREVLEAFAQQHGWRYLDLTEPSRRAVQAHQAWLYGQHDRSHWSPRGTTIMAEVLRRELSSIIGAGAAELYPATPESHTR
jgi:hypothetical protein